MTDRTHAIRQFIIDEFIPDTSVEHLELDYDLLEGGVIDSLGLLQVIAWLEDRYDVPLDDAELGPDTFRSVRAIDDFVAGLGV